MEAFEGYGSDSGSEREGGAGEPLAPAAPLWQADDDGSDDEEGGEGAAAGGASGPAQKGEGVAVPGDEGEGAAVPAAAPPDAKKRKLIDPFAALSKASASFLGAGQAVSDEPEFFSDVAREGSKDCSAPPEPAHTEPARESAAGGTAAAKPASRPPPAAVPAGKPAKKDETTRQRNARKEKLGQAKFTVKSNRECPDIWQGPS
jgi:hypothetical protein